MNRETLGKMRPSAILMNASRGPVVDSDALYEALKAGVIAGAALDVTEPEPMPGDHQLVSLPNCLIRAPHRLGLVRDARQRWPASLPTTCWPGPHTRRCHP